MGLDIIVPAPQHPPSHFTVIRWYVLTRGTDLDTLAAHPDYQRRGAGSMLLQWGCDMADKDGVALYVDASKAGAPLYQRFVTLGPFRMSGCGEGPMRSAT